MIRKQGEQDGGDLRSDLEKGNTTWQPLFEGYITHHSSTNTHSLWRCRVSYYHQRVRGSVYGIRPWKSIFRKTPIANWPRALQSCTERNLRKMRQFYLITKYCRRRQSWVGLSSNLAAGGRIEGHRAKIRLIREIRGSLSFCLSTFYLPPSLSELRGFNLVFIRVHSWWVESVVLFRDI